MSIAFLIQFTVAVVDQVLPSKSLKVNTKLPLPVNVYPVALCPVNVLLNPVNAAITFPVV